MEQKDHSRGNAGPPLNPELRELVVGKQRWTGAPHRMEQMAGFRGWHERGYLPHRDARGLIQLVTFRLADAFPRNLRAEWARLVAMECGQERRKLLETYLDLGRGERHLRNPEVAKVVQEAWLFHHGKRYELLAWVVMPNHVHGLIRVHSVSLSVIIGELKAYTAREANRILGHRGSFWAPDYWDTFMRNSDHELRARRYVENNPAKAHLVRDPHDWPWSSARFRDKNGLLHL